MWDGRNQGNGQLNRECEARRHYGVDLLYTSNRDGTISLDRNGEPLTPPISTISTKNDQDPLAWRQWHHWNVLRDAAEVDLPKGISVITVHILTQGNMNLAFFDFRYKLLL